MYSKSHGISTSNLLLLRFLAFSTLQSPFLGVRDERQNRLEGRGEVSSRKTGEVGLGRFGDMCNFAGHGGRDVDVLLHQATYKSNGRSSAGIDEFIQPLQTRSTLHSANGLDSPDPGRERSGEGFDFIDRRDGLPSRGGADDLLNQGGVVISRLQAGRKRGKDLTEMFELVERGGSADNLNGQESRRGIQDVLKGIGVVAGDGDIAVSDRGSFELIC